MKSADELRHEADEVEQHGTSGGKNPGRVAGGKRAAATRKERYGSALPPNARNQRNH